MQPNETAMSAALKRSGFDTGTRLHAVMARIWADEKGDQARAPKALWAALEADTELRMQAMLALLSVPAEDMHGMPGEGQRMVADQGQASLAPARQQNGGGAGQDASAEVGHHGPARPFPQSREKGARRLVPQGQNGFAPAREPSAAARAAKGRVALKSARAVANLGWLADAVIPQGPRIIDLRWRDVPEMVARMRGELGKNAQITVALMAIEANGNRQGVIPPDDHWIDHMPPELTRFISDRTEKEALGEMAVEWFSAYGHTMLKTMIGGGDAA